METIDLTPIVQAVIALAATLITTFLIPYVKSKVGEQNMTEFLRWVDIAVAAAEQIYDSSQGNLKKKYVLSYLRANGYEVDEDTVDLAIEAAVIRLHTELYGAEREESFSYDGITASK